MIWLKVAMIVFICTSMNHLGLIEAIENVIGFKIPIIDCCKCSTFWTVITYLLCEGLDIGIVAVIATAFLACIAAVWLELAMGLLDTLYDKCYERIFYKATVTETDGDKGNSEPDNQGDT